MGVCEPSMPDYMASKAQSQLCELSGSTFRFNMQEFSMVGGYTESLKNHKTVKIGGWALARVWALAWDKQYLQRNASLTTDLQGTVSKLFRTPYKPFWRWLVF